MINEISGLNKSVFAYSINKAIDNFEEHELEVVYKQEQFDKKIQSYMKKIIDF